MPPWLLSIILVFGSYRLTRLITKDDFPPVLWMRDKLAGGWRPLTTKEQEQTSTVLQSVQDTYEHPEFGQVRMINFQASRYVRRAKWSPWWLADLVSCPWCVSAYVSLALVGVTALWIGLPVPLLMWFAVWGASALLASKEWA
jgi:hypothetical protein